jgi:hypothetical protein
MESNLNRGGELTSGTGETTSSLKKQNCLALTGGEAQNRTGDTRIFSPLLYRLSYLAPRFSYPEPLAFVNTKSILPKALTLRKIS